MSILGLFSLLIFCGGSLCQTTPDYDAYGATPDPWSSWNEPPDWYDPNNYEPDNYDYYNGGADFLTEMLANSANLTEANARCDEILAENIQNKSSKSNTQPVIPIYIDVRLVLITLNDISDSQGTISITARLDFRWYDKRLELTPPNNVTCANQTLLVKTESIWFPYFIVQNGASNIFYPDAWEKYPSSVRSDGYIDWRTAFKFDLTCDMDFTIFPFDTQICKVLIQSPHFGNSELIYNVSDSTRSVLFFKQEDASKPMWEVDKQKVKFTSKVPGIVFFMTFKSNHPPP